MTGCHDCGRPYGNEHGFPDLVIPNDVWRRISPSGNDGGLLCPSCLCARLHQASITCEGAFMSGPIDSVDRRLMWTMRMRSEENTSELQSLKRISYDVSCL